MELIEQDLLRKIGTADTAQPEGAPVGRLQQDVATLDPPQAVQGVLRGQRRARPLEGVFERDPEGVAQKRHEDVGLDASVFLIFCLKVRI